MNQTPLFPLPNATSLVGLFQYSNTVTNDIFGVATLFAFFLVATIGMSHAGIEKSIPAGAFLTMMISYLFFIPGLVSEYVPIIFTILTGISMIAMKR